MTVEMDVGYTRFSSKGSFEDKIVCTSEEIENKKTVIPAFQVFEMLRKLPEGVKWNPDKEDFEYSKGTIWG